MPEGSHRSVDQLPLHGIRVLDLTSSVAGPFCTQLLGALGAEVIKVERPGSGDDSRSWGPPSWGADSAMFLAMNAGKRSIQIDLRTDQGVGIARRLVAGSDILVESLRPGLCDELGLGFDDVKRLRPSIVYCAIGAYGAVGPQHAQPGYDPLMQAAGGIMSVTGEPGSPPVRAGISVIDQGTALWAVVGILAALRANDEEPRARLVDTSLYEAAISWMGYHLVGYLGSGEIPGRVGSAFPSVAPYQAFESADGWLVIAASNDAQFARLCDVIGRTDLPRDTRFASNPDRVANREELAAQIQARLADGSVGEWLERLSAAGVPAAPVQDTSQVAVHPQTVALEMLRSMPGHAVSDLKVVAAPVSIDRARVAARSAPPRAGEHSDQILAELGITAAEVSDLRARGVVG